MQAALAVQINGRVRLVSEVNGGALGLDLLRDYSGWFDWSLFSRRQVPAPLPPRGRNAFPTTFALSCLFSSNSLASPQRNNSRDGISAAQLSLQYGAETEILHRPRNNRSA